MTDEQMTEIERARADLALTVGVIRDRLTLRAQRAALQRHRVGVAATAAGLVALGAAVYLLARALGRRG
jgi:hypothetical protein